MNNKENDIHIKGEYNYNKNLVNIILDLGRSENIVIRPEIIDKAKLIINKNSLQLSTEGIVKGIQLIVNSDANQLDIQLASPPLSVMMPWTGEARLAQSRARVCVPPPGPCQGRHALPRDRPCRDPCRTAV